MINLENEELLKIIQESIEDKKGFEIEIIEIGKFTTIADFFVIAEGNSQRHLKTLAEEISVRIKKSGIHPISIEGIRDDSGWILIDYGSVVVHLFLEEKRKKVKLEEFWKTEIKKIKK
ncbi:MAG TPA: ribosome silencing factor [bacterium]|nr:ribosome silencing factor [bacterium]HPN30503.1 ribosome silencing factor [bacterium]